MEDLYAIPLGVDAPRAIINGLLQRYKNRPPQDLARVTLIVNTTRMKRRLEQLLRDNAALLHPRLLTLEELEHLAPLTQITAPSDNLARRFELIAMIGRLLQAQPDLAPRASLLTWPIAWRR